MARPSPRLFTIPPDIPFLKALARAILAGGFPLASTPAPGPLDLPRWSIYLPTRRAARALTQAFLELQPSGTRLLPRIRTLGDVDEEELAFAEPLPGAGGEEIAPAISPIERQFLLARLISAWVQAHPQADLARALAAAPGMGLLMAQSLGRLLDNFEMEEVPLEALANLAGPEYPEHREALIGFLDILRVAMPKALASLGLIGAGARRSAAIRAEAKRLALAAPDAPVIAAGSTGSIPATAELLQVIARLPQGAVVLPGLDLGLDEKAWELLSRADQQQHPQWGLSQLLTRMGAARSDVELLPAAPRRADGEAREFLLSELMRPSAATDQWREALAAAGGRLEQAMGAIRLLFTPDTRQEAASIALLMRRVLETPGRTAALVTPDRNLARRVKAELLRWQVELDDTAGEPLARSPEASFLRMLMEAAVEPLQPQALIALLRHPLMGCDAASLIDLSMRGMRAPESLAGLAAFLEKRAAASTRDEHVPIPLRRADDAQWANGIAHARRLAAALQPLADALRKASPLEALLSAHLAAAEALCGKQSLWQAEAGEALSLLFQALREAAPAAPLLEAADYLTLVSGHFASIPLRTLKPSHPRLAVYGLLEARLVSADVMILGGLNETVWPEEAETDPWLSRPMKDKLGLMLPERRIGLTAHDFVQAFSGDEIWLSCARKRDGVPAVPSRWLLRLEALLKAAGLKHLYQPDTRLAGMAMGLDLAEHPQACDPPRACPPLGLRPQRLSVTQAEKLINDPYSYYARHVLRLELLKALGPGDGSAERGTLMHAALERFTRRHPGPLGDAALANLLACGREVFAEAGADKEIHGFWWPQFERIAAWFITTERELRANIIAQLSEEKGEIRFDIDGVPHALSARADRIDVDAEGLARILDYKTGDEPNGKELADGRKPQLPLEAYMLAHGGFPAAKAEAASSIAVLKLSGADPAGELTQFTKDIAALAEENFQALRELLRAYRDPAQAYLPLPEASRREDYDHLARYAEWQAGLGGEGADEA